jgi:RHS repeat-associated protein
MDMWQRLTRLLAPLMLTGLIVLSRPASAVPVVIDFEDLPAGAIGTPAEVFVNNQYADRGITFNNPVALDYSLGAVAIPDFAHSGTKAVEQCYAIEFCTTPIEMNFTAAQTRVKVWVGFSEFFVGRTESFTVLLRAFDAGGGEVGRAMTALLIGSEPIPIRMPLEVTSANANITRAVVQLLLPDGSVTVTNGLAVDDVEFDTAGPARPIETTFGPRSPANPSGTVAEPVNTATGNYVFQRTDLLFPSRGLPVMFIRTYNAQDASTGPLGHGWTHSYHIRLTEHADGTVVIKQGDGHEEFYEPTEGGRYQSRFGGVFNTLVKNLDATFTLTSRDQTHYQFSPSGQLIHIIDRNGNMLSLSYDADGHLITITDPVGRRVRLDYDPGGRIAFITDPLGRVVRYSYDAAGNLAADTDPNGGVMQYHYDTAHRLTQIIDRRGILLVENTYDAAGRVIAQVNGRGFVTTFAYGSPQPGDTSITDPRGGTTNHTHDEQLRPIAVTDPLGHQVSLTYDAESNRISIRDENGAITRFTYDDRGNTTSIIDPLGHILAFTYDPGNNRTSLTNARGLTTTLQYDAQGNLSSVQDALGNLTTFAYDGFGQLTQRTDARGNILSYIPDAQGNVAAIIDALGGITSSAYDEIGRLIRLTDPNGHTIAMSYDANSQLIQVMDPLGHATSFAYDPAGNLIEITDAKGNTTRYGYDEAKNLTTVTDALGHLTRNTYDANNNRTAVTDANAHTTAYAFDALDRLTTITDPLGHTITYGYDSSGNLTGVVDANGTPTTFVYDANHLLTAIAYGDGSSVAYGYDADGNRVSRTDRRGTTTYTYDALNHLVQITHADGRPVAYGYDTVGNQIRLTYPGGKEAIYGYDALDRLTHVLDWRGRETRYRYDAASNLLEVQYPNRTAISYRYDAADQLVEVSHNQEEVPLARFTYTLDALGNRIGTVEESLLTPRTRFAYAYDPLSQLVAVEKRPEKQPLQRTEYTYDQVGNRLSLTAFSDEGEGAPTELITYTYDAANRLLQAGTTTFAYDANGSRLAETIPGEPTIQYAYDAANRLIRVMQHDTEVAYTYDADDNKVEQAIKAPPEAGGPRTIRFLNDEAALVVVALTQDVVAEGGEPGEPTHYLYGLALISEELPDLESHPFFYHADGLGSTIALTDQLGMVQAHYRYDAWGNLEQSLGNVPNRFLFTGEEQDPQTGLYYLRARWYDPRVGRFLTKDPFGGLAERPQSVYPYIYVSNNPANLVDPLGIWGWPKLPNPVRAIRQAARVYINVAFILPAKIAVTAASFQLSPMTSNLGLALGLAGWLTNQWC